MLRPQSQDRNAARPPGFFSPGGGTLLGIPLTIVFALLLSTLGLLSGAMPSQAHHRHQYYFHWAGFPTQILVYNCSADATTLQTAINNWNSSGGFGTVFSYQGVNCNPAGGIVAKTVSLPSGVAGRLWPVSYSSRIHESHKDSTQRGRVYYAGAPGMFRITKADLQVASFALYDVAVYAHELGHAIGLNEHYLDVSTASCVPYSVATIMDCSGTDTGPSSHDSNDARGRYDQAPWGPGAIWIHSDTGTSITIKWAEINDNESGYRVMRTTAPGIGGEQQQGPIQPADTDTFSQAVTSGQQYCYHLKVTHYLVVDGYSSQICRFNQPASPMAPANVSVSAGPNNYTAVLNWTQNDGGYTHHFVYVQKPGSTHAFISRYYLPYSGTGSQSLTVTLGLNDELSGTYYFYVSTCNAKYNAWNPSASCVAASPVTRYLSP